MNDQRYVMGGFLRRQSTDSLWRPKGGTDVLILHKQRLGEDSPWHLTRVQLNGAAAWTCPIGLAELQYVCDAGDTIVFTGFADMSQPTGERPERFVMVDPGRRSFRNRRATDPRADSANPHSGSVVAAERLTLTKRPK